VSNQDGATAKSAGRAPLLSTAARKKGNRPLQKKIQQRSSKGRNYCLVSLRIVAHLLKEKLSNKNSLN